MRDLPPLFRTFRLAWKPTEVKNITMHTFFSVSSKENSRMPKLWSTQVRMANTRPPTTGAGMQKVSRNLIFFRRKAPRNSTRTATATVWYIST